MTIQKHRQWWLLGAMSAVLGLIVLDETIVTVSLPSITTELGMSTAQAHWVVNAYLLSFTCFVAIAGRLGDHFSRRNYFLGGAALFALASIFAALASDGATLIAARALQGIAAAIVFPTSIALITAAFAPEKRGVAFGYQTTVGGIFMASGPLIGGLLTEIVTWRMIFWIGVPVIVAIVVLLWLTWSPSYNPQKQKGAPIASRMEAVAPVFLILALFGLVTSVMQGPTWGWGSPLTLGLLILGCGLLVIFVFKEVSTTAPFLDLTLLRIPEFRGAAIVFAIFQFEKITMFVFTAQYFQAVLGKSPIMSGVAVSLAILPTLGTSILIGKSVDRYGSRYVILRGVAIHGAAIVLLAFLTLERSFSLIIVALVIWGASMPSLAIPMRRVLMSSVPKHKHGLASGINLTVQMLGGSLGFAVCSALLTETQSYTLLFFVVGVGTLASIWVAGASIKRHH